MKTKRTLIIVDVQYDFLQGGSLAVPRADRGYVEDIESIRYKFDQIILSADHHPEHHSSFSVFPPHCVAGTHGAELAVTRGDYLLLKGEHQDKDEFSAFIDGRNIEKITGEEVYVLGLAGDYCVKQTLLDLLEFAPDKKYFAVTDLIKSVDGTEYGPLDYFDGRVIFITSDEIGKQPDLNC